MRVGWTCSRRSPSERAGRKSSGTGVRGVRSSVPLDSCDDLKRLGRKAMLLRRLVTVAVLLGLLAIFLVYEHSRVTRAGIEISRLSRDEARLVEELRMLNVRVMRLCQPEFIRGQVEKLRIDLMQAPDARVLPVASRQPTLAEPTNR